MAKTAGDSQRASKRANGSLDHAKGIG